MSAAELRLSTADMMAAIQAMDPEAKKELDAFLLAGGAPIWVPQDGPQLMAYLSQADIVFYGGAAGGGKGLSLDTLSMGMSHDLEAAIAEGATMVRVGTAIFGERNKA